MTAEECRTFLTHTRTHTLSQTSSHSILLSLFVTQHPTSALDLTLALVLVLVLVLVLQRCECQSFELSSTAAPDSSILIARPYSDSMQSYSIQFSAVQCSSVQCSSV